MNKDCEPRKSFSPLLSAYGSRRYPYLVARGLGQSSRLDKLEEKLQPELERQKQYRIKNYMGINTDGGLLLLELYQPRISIADFIAGEAPETVKTAEFRIIYKNKLLSGIVEERVNTGFFSTREARYDKHRRTTSVIMQKTNASDPKDFERLTTSVIYRADESLLLFTVRAVRAGLFGQGALLTPEAVTALKNDHSTHAWFPIPIIDETELFGIHSLVELPGVHEQFTADAPVFTMRDEIKLSDSGTTTLRLGTNMLDLMVNHDDLTVSERLFLRS
jgi:hypothetical protein